MTTTVKNLLPSKTMEVTQQMQYTAQDVTAVIDKCTIINTTTSNANFSLNIVRAGGVADDSNSLIKSKTLIPNQTYNCPELVGHTLNSGQFISTIASVLGLSIRISGREVS